jgi:DoxX-like protein
MTLQSNNLTVRRDENSRWTKSSTNYLLWTIQMLLALLFLFAGGIKLVLPIEAMTKEILLPGWFLRFIGVAEMMGALGLVLPWFFRIKRILTPVAASGLVIIMIGATIITIASGSIGAAVTPFVVGMLLSLIAYGRWTGLRAFAADGRAVGVPIAAQTNQ